LQRTTTQYNALQHTVTHANDSPEDRGKNGEELAGGGDGNERQRRKRPHQEKYEKLPRR